MRDWNRKPPQCILWYCCMCGYGGMSTENNPECVDCKRHPKCKKCPLQRGLATEKDTILYTEKEGTDKHEALRKNSNRHKHETSSQVTHHAPVSRAASLIQGSTPLRLSSPQHTPRNISEPPYLIPLNQSNFGPISGSEAEISRSGERTPRNVDLPEEAIDVTTPKSGFDNNAAFEDFLIGRVDFDPFFYAETKGFTDIFHHDSSAGRQSSLPRSPPYGEETVNTDDVEFQFQEVSCDNQRFTIDPQKTWITPPTYSSSTYVASTPGNLQYPTLPTDPIDNSPAGTFQHEHSFYSPMVQPLQASYEAQDVLSPAHPAEIASPLAVPAPRHLDYASKESQQLTKKRKFSRREQGDEEIDRAIQACEHCLLALKPDEDRRLACPFYKRNPGRYSHCFQKEFKNVSALRQHLDKDHKLGKHHCSNCWDTFPDQSSLKAHAGCQPTGGVPVNQLPKVSKARGGPESKWYWIWRKLFGEVTPEPKCPYPHPMQDMAGHIFSHFVQYVAAQGAEVDNGVKGHMLQFLASNTDLSNSGHEHPGYPGWLGT
ncbi:hypothetical protein M426DRAFT_17241 [Hypoxylon sp. CI-4A]|nr:hypothetical protein M426DRAFT_17241 [Hypoxylon sp. CI-4A]